MDLLLVARYALLISLTHLIPIPLLDMWIADQLRARLARLQLAPYDVKLSGREARLLGGATAGGCLGLIWGLLVWPIKRALRFLLWFLLIKAMVDTFSDVVARAVMVDEALAAGLLPGDVIRARAAIQRASRGVSTKPFERAVGLIFRTTRREMWRWLGVARSRMRQEARKEQQHDPASPTEGDPLNASLEAVVQTLARAIWVPEVHEKLRAALRREIAALPDAPAPETANPTPPDAPERTA
ncbi:MAG: hypothetical protein EA397_02090 [Deltaproteobacteria bacterium]|nr:MAG: hypothetical protein EA397_02090 [Deltaproteobacteria bacterium]